MRVCLDSVLGSRRRPHVAAVAVVLLGATLAAAQGRARPWTAPDQLGGTQRTWDQLLGAELPETPLSAKAFRNWFAPLEGDKSKVVEDKKTFQSRATGLWKLRAPWPDNAVLRLRVAPGTQLRVHLWHGTRGVSLIFGDTFQAPQSWVAYHVSREAKSFRPTRYALTADDAGTWARIQPPAKAAKDLTVLPTDIRFQDGKIVLACAGVRLLEAALAGRPDAVCIEDAAAPGISLLSVSMAVSEPLGEAPVPAIKTTIDHARLDPASMKTAGGEVRGMADGRVWVAPPSKGSVSWAAVVVKPGGIREYIVEIENAQPGVGVFLADSTGVPLPGPRISTGKTGTLVRMTAATQGIAPYTPPPAISPDPRVGSIVRLRVRAIGGTIRAWASTPSGGWAALWPHMAMPANAKPITLVGAYCATSARKRDQKPHGFILRRIQVREYPAINALADAALIARAPDLHAVAANEWLAKAVAARPGGTALNPWLRACAIRSLADGAPAALAGALLEALAADVAAAPGPWQGKLELLSQLVELSPGPVKHWTRTEELLERVGRQALTTDGPEAIVPLTARVFSVAPPAGGSVETLWQNLARTAAVACVPGGRWETFKTVQRHLRGLGRGGMDVLAWCRSLSPDAVQDIRGFQHPWGFHDSRSERAFRMDFHIAVAGGQMDNACRLLISREAEEVGFGLVRSAVDPSGWVSLESTAGVLMQRYPQVQQALSSQYTLRGRLRVRQAIADKDAARVAAVTGQFYGTPAAAEAHIWLGDRAYLAKQYASAQEHYAAAVDAADILSRADAQIRHRLAAAHRGRTVGSPASKAITLGGQTWPPQKIEQTVAQALRAAGPAKAPAAAAGTLPWTVPQPATFRAIIGQMPPRPPAIAAAAWTPTMAAALMTARPHAQTFGSGATCQRVGHELKCVGAGNWHHKIPGVLTGVLRGRRGAYYRGALPFAKQPPRWFLISNPVVVGPTVYGLFEKKMNAEGTGSVRLHTYQVRDGKRVIDEQILAMGAFTGGKLAFDLLVVGDRLVIWHKGAMLNIQRGGNVHWARLPEYVAFQGGTAKTPTVNPLYVVGRRGYLADDGMPYVECIDMDRGTRLWVSEAMETRRVLSVSDGRVIVETADELLALSDQDGTVLWRKTTGHLPSGAAADATAVLYARLGPATGTPPVRPVELVWLDAKTGQPRATSTVANALGPNVQVMRFGPMVGVGQELLALAQAGGGAVQVVRLTPAGGAAAFSADREQMHRWGQALR